MSGVNKFCSAACRGKWKYITGVASTENQYAAITGNWDRYVCRLLAYHGKHGLAVRKTKGLSKETLLALLDAQGGRCALSGVPLTCTLKKGERAWTNASIDRIDPTKGYDLDNIHLVCAAVNGFKYNLGVGEFVWWCTQVAEHAGKHKPSTAPAPIEEGRKEHDHGETA